MRKLFTMSKEIELMSSVEVFGLIEAYYEHWIEEGFFNVLKSDADIFILEEKESKNRIVIKRENLVTPDISIQEGWEWRGLEKCFRNYNYELDNSKMKYSKEKGFYNNNYAEYFIQYLTIEDIFSETLNFKIDDVEIEIGSPSETFKLIFNHISTDQYFDWGHYYTIKLRNVKKNMLEDYLQNALYFLHKYYPPDWVNEYPFIFQYTYLEDKWGGGKEVDDSISDQNLSLGNYTEALAFYNEGKRKRDFLNFYRVLEYFFLISRKDDFESFIFDYNQNKDIDKVLNKITKVYKQSEEVLLENFLNKINNIEAIMDKAFSKRLINNKTDKEEFASKLYTYRNSRVHGKRDTKMDLLVPAIVDSNNKDWEIIIENIAELVVKQFCYS